MTLRSALVACAMCASCAAAGARPGAEHRADVALQDVAPRGTQRYTVLIFFSADCHALRAHDERIRALASEFAARGVRFVALDPETRASAAGDRDEASRRGYPFPILLDDGARIAHALGAAYAGHAVVVDPTGAIVYQGGIDSDRVHLTDDATPYLRNALIDLLAGREPRVADAKVLGCALRTW
jgi:hypothetical protein